MNTSDRVVIVISAILTFLLASVGVTAIYLAAGGRFHWGVPLTLYLIAEVYLAALIFRIARRRNQEQRKEMGPWW